MTHRFITIILLVISLTSISQTSQDDLTQTIRGVVIDEESKVPVFTASVLILGTNPPIGASADINGKFKLEDIPVGRYDLRITCIGYREKIIPNVLVGAGKETVLNIQLAETTTDLSEVIITAQKDKNKPQNELGLVSARGFSVEETKRYAGSLDDPARMASGFAGVSTVGDGNNDIIIRGNSPKGLLWRLEGMEVPNPNHFANDGASGGPISVLNSNMLANSDFFTGAWPAEYGNAFSGAFDISLRQGNNEKREYAIQLGALGTDVALEGPFNKETGSSYLVNYRYSTLAMLTSVGIKVAGENIPKYQDASFKLHLPTEKSGTFTVYGIGGKSGIHWEARKDEDNEDSDVYYYEDFDADLGVLGVNHFYILDEKTYLKSSLAVSTAGQDFTSHLTNDRGGFFQQNDYRVRNSAVRGQLIINHKFNAKHSVKLGIIHSYLHYDLLDKYRINSDDEFTTNLDGRDHSSTDQSFVNWKYKLNDQVVLNSGVHMMRFNLNGNTVIEPRVSAKWQWHPRHSVHAGIGLHSRLETLSQYAATDEDANGELFAPNENLDLMKAAHYILGYQFKISNNTFFTAETYYQSLYDVPIEDKEGSAMSLLNFGQGYTTRPLVNEGTARNYGVDLTLERFFSGGYYFLITNSLYQSLYTAKDGIERDTRYNGNYVGNVIAGKEFDVSRNGKNRTLTLSTKGSLAGGNRYTPINLEASIAAGEEVLYEDRPYSIQAPMYKRFDFQITLRTDKKKTTREWKLDVQNVTNSQNVVDVYYNWYTETIENSTQLGLLPVLSYKIMF